MTRYTPFLAALLTAVFFAASAQATQVINRIVAVVNGESITLTELDNHLTPYLAQMQDQGYSLMEQEAAVPELRQRVLNNMINNILLLQEAERLGLEISVVEVENYINQFKSDNNLTEDMLQAQLAYEGLTRSEYEEQVQGSMLRNRLISFMVRRKVVVTAQEVEDYFLSHPEEFGSDQQISVSVLLVPDQDQIVDLRERILDGELSFADAARQYSQGPEAENGGDFGEFNFRELSDDWKEALAGLGQGDVSEPFFVNNMWGLLYVNGFSSQGDVNMSDVEDEIFDLLEREKMAELLDDYIEELRDKAIIDIRL